MDICLVLHDLDLISKMNCIIHKNMCFMKRVKCRLGRSPSLCIGLHMQVDHSAFRGGVLTTACWARWAVQRTLQACRWCTQPWTRTAGCGPAPWQRTSTPRPPGVVGDSGSTTGHASTHARPLILSNMDIQSIWSLIQGSYGLSSVMLVLYT